MIMQYKLDIQTSEQAQMVDITPRIRELLSKAGVSEGVLLVYCPHTTAGVTINENADPNVVRDLLNRLQEMVPFQHPADRHAEGNSAAHLKASMMGFSQLIPINMGRLMLGTWQGIYLCEFDGPRRRTCYIQIHSQATV